MLTQNQLTHVCKLHQGNKQCRYVSEGEGGDAGNYFCLKLNDSKKKEIDDGVNEFIKKQKADGVDLDTVSDPIGDGAGCSGYIVLKSKKQGYDV